MPLRLSGPPHNTTVERVVPSIAGGLQNLPLALWLESILTHKSMVHKENEVKSVSRSVVSDSLRPRGLWPARLLCPWDSPGKDTGVGSLSLLQVIFLTQELNLGLLHCRQILYCLSHQGSPTLKPGSP